MVLYIYSFLYMELGDARMTVTCRKATETDIESMFQLIDGYAVKGIMLPRSRDLLRRQLEHFYIAEDEAALIGCGSLCKLGEELVEIRSLGVNEQAKGHGVGRKLVKLLEEEAREKKFRRLMALTYETAFFEKVGFRVVSKEIFPEKVWTDCVYCKKQDCCDEIAVLKDLN